VMEIPVRMRQTRTLTARRESPKGFKCQNLSTSGKAHKKKKRGALPRFAVRIFEQSSVVVGPSGFPD
jgi:hypothetical protein